MVTRGKGEWVGLRRGNDVCDLEPTSPFFSVSGNLIRDIGDGRSEGRGKQGEDTRTNFTDHLYSALQLKSIHTYKDDERIKKGKRINDELIRSIEDSRFYIIVFLKNYASSSWCLDELVKIIECHKQSGHISYPVFYNVVPSEVRNRSGAIGEAFSKHEKEEAAGKWREAMKEAADLAGWELKKTDDG
ncbi:unnamed protein product [Lactuca virosa]|uniref:TIR domain-containing protein n=1 Tax=Lactuca virosa TaxID=75947 RepID=A0AAU9P2S0_9ASTR|nr:unnamed protein product [Lactuca virosa]